MSDSPRDAAGPVCEAVRNHPSDLPAAIAAMPGEKVTVAQMEARIKDVAYVHLGETVTLCNLTLDNGYSVRGESACVDPANYRQAIGEKLAYDDAFRKLWPLFGFLLAERRHGGSDRSDIAGALFDFLAFLTTHDETITVGASHPPYDLLAAYEVWATGNGLDIHAEVNVLGWHRFRTGAPGPTATATDGGTDGAGA